MPKVYVGDFETTVYIGQKHTEVWASGCCELFTEDVQIFHSIDEQFEYFIKQKANIKCYYHNLKFDGEFWLSYLLVKLRFKQAYTQDPNDINTTQWLDNKDMPNKSFKYSISSMGQWYSFTIKIGGKIIELRDSYKLLPFSLARIGKSFKTKHQKLDMEYKGFRYSGCVITEDEKEYLKNDLLVLKEALEIMFTEKHTKLTIGSCCLAEYKNLISVQCYNDYFPDIYEHKIDPTIHSVDNSGEWVRKSYRGGWCYVVKGCESKIYYNGTTADVNSLYPSVMHSESGNRYPVGRPIFWVGEPPRKVLNDNEIYYFIRLKTRFKIKHNKLPFIQIKNSFMYKHNEMLTTSDIFNIKDGKYYSEYVDVYGNIQQAKVELTLTMTDYKLLLDHYDLYDTEYIDGCYFNSEIGIFDKYINKYKEIKINSKGAKRELAKLFLNNLYGKMASNKNSSFKVAYIKDDNTIGYYTVVQYDKQAGYIPVGSAITSYARDFTIRTAQQNYYGVGKRGFKYADTDSIHCDLKPEELKGITVHDSNFCCWKLESQWDLGYFVRQKTYIEHNIIQDGVLLEEPYYNIKCAGMPEKCKSLFVKSLAPLNDSNKENYTQEEYDFLFENGVQKIRTIEDFNVGLVISGKLLPKRINGGIVLVDTNYEMR